MTATSQQCQDCSDSIQIEGLCKSFDRQLVFEQLNLIFSQGQFTSLLGPNGCGKSTLMNILAGVTRCDRGRVTIVPQFLAQKRIGYVFQNYRAALFPWLTVRDNLLYPLKLHRIPPRERQARLDQFLAVFDIHLDLTRYPYQFSGGQQQFIAILRALMIRPNLLLLDEPFSSLDLEMTLYMRDKLGRICREMGLTTLMISHDLDDLVYLADRMIILSQRPAQILAEIPVSLPYPRTPEVLADPDFIQIKRQCLDLFLQETQR